MLVSVAYFVVGRRNHQSARPVLVCWVYARSVYLSCSVPSLRAKAHCWKWYAFSCAKRQQHGTTLSGARSYYVNTETAQGFVSILVILVLHPC